MRRGVREFFNINWKVVTIFIIGTVLDAGSTTLAKMKPGTIETNPVGAALIHPGAHLTTFGLLTLLPLIALALIGYLWAIGINRETWKVVLEGGGVMQIMAAINNTLIYYGHGTPYALLALVALGSHYITRIHITWKRERGIRKLRELLPTTPF